MMDKNLYFPIFLRHILFTKLLSELNNSKVTTNISAHYKQTRPIIDQTGLIFCADPLNVLC